MPGEETVEVVVYTGVGSDEEAVLPEHEGFRRGFGSRHPSTEEYGVGRSLDGEGVVAGATGWISPIVAVSPGH